MKKFIKSLGAMVLMCAIAGCKGGGGGSSSSMLSSLSDTVSSGGPDASTLTDAVTVATVHNPEPATMLLWGAGLLGAAWMSKRKKK